MTWPERIAALKALLKRTGRLWTGTELSGYAADGPYHCGDCRFLIGVDGCGHSVVQADPEVPHAGGLPIVDPARGCCEFVDPRKSNPGRRTMTPREKARKRRGGQASRAKQGGMSLPTIARQKSDKEFHRAR